MTSIDEYNRRMANVRRVMEARGIQCALLNRGPSIKYLTGVFNTCSWVFITRDDRRVAVVLESGYLEYRARPIVEDVRTHRPHDPAQLFRAL